MKERDDKGNAILTGKLPASEALEAKAVFEEIASEIQSLDNAVKELERGRLRRRALLVLLKDVSGIPIAQIDRVLKSLGELRATYLKS